MTFWTELLGRDFRVETVDANGIRTRALIMGSGEPVIFLHGISGHLEAFIPAAARFGEGYELHLLDLLGHGWTGKPGGQLGIDRLAEHVIDYMDARGIKKAHVVGISLGGWVAGWLAVHHSDRMLASILIAAGGNPAMAKPAALEYIRNGTIAGVMSDDRDDTRKRLQSVVFKPESADEELIDVRYAAYHSPEFQANLDGLLAVLDLDTYMKFALTPERLRLAEVPILIVWGEDDDRSGIADAEFLALHIPETKIVRMTETGHWPPYERPDDFVKIAKSFFEHGLSAVKEGRQ